MSKLIGKRKKKHTQKNIESPNFFTQKVNL